MNILTWKPAIPQEVTFLPFPSPITIKIMLSYY